MTTPADDDVIPGLIPNVYDVLSFAGLERLLADDNALGYAVADVMADDERVAEFNNYIEKVGPAGPATERILAKLREADDNGEADEAATSRFANHV